MGPTRPTLRLRIQRTLPPPCPTHNHPIFLPPPPFALSYTLAPRPAPTAPDLDLLCLPSFVHPSSAPALFRFLLDTMPWYRVKYRVRGIDINTPRWTTVFGKDGQRREWDGYKCRPRAIPPVLLMLMQKVEQATGEHFNFCLVNYYGSGSDSISFHSDSEHFLGPDPTIASLSLGAPREFHLRHKDHGARAIPVVKLTMRDGDMVVMRGRTQDRWEHSVPKRARAEGRINITFRKAVVKYGTENYNTYNVGTGPMYRFIDGHMVEQPRIGPDLAVSKLDPATKLELAPAATNDQADAHVTSAELALGPEGAGEQAATPTP
ncbi:hypothetical protein Q5752_001742 [Cryptotrichosporon argae]